MHHNQARSWQQDYAPQRERDKKVVVKVRKVGWLTKGEKVIYTFFLGLIILATYYIVSFSSSLDNLNREYQTLESEVNQVKTTNDILIYEMKELSEPSRILRIA